MKHSVVFSLFLGLALLPCSCQSELMPSPPQEISIGVDGDSSCFVEVKGTDITSVPSIVYYGIFTGGNSAGTSSESLYSGQTVQSASLTSGRIETGIIQSSPAASLNYYVSNVSFSSSGTITVSSNTTDVLAGRLWGSTSATPNVSLEHIFSKTGTLTVQSQSGWTYSNIKWYISSYGTITGKAGVYNMRTQAWTSRSSALASTQINSSSNLYVIPGVYKINVTFTATHEGKAYSVNQEGLVTFVKGRKMNITVVPNLSISALDEGWESGGGIILD